MLRSVFRKTSYQVLLVVGLVAIAANSYPVELNYKVSVYGKHVGYIRVKREGDQANYSFQPTLGVASTSPDRLYLINGRTGLPAYQSEPEACDSTAAALERVMTELYFEDKGMMWQLRFQQQAARAGLPRAPSVLPPLGMSPLTDEVGKYMSLFQLSLQAIIQVGEDGIITTQTHEHNPSSGSGLASNTEGNTELGTLLLQGTQAFYNWLDRAAEQAKVSFFEVGIGAASITRVQSQPSPNGETHTIIIEIEQLAFILVVAVVHGQIHRIRMTDRSGVYAVDILLLRAEAASKPGPSSPKWKCLGIF